MEITDVVRFFPSPVTRSLLISFFPRYYDAVQAIII